MFWIILKPILLLPILITLGIIQFLIWIIRTGLSLIVDDLIQISILSVLIFPLWMISYYWITPCIKWILLTISNLF